MRTIIFTGAAVIALLAGCNDAADTGDAAPAPADAGGASADDVPLAGEAPGFEAVAPGTYEVTHAEGTVSSIEIHPGMTYSRVDADGNATGGSIYMEGGKTCFNVEGSDTVNCFTDGAMASDGSMETTSADGAVSRVRRVDGSLEDSVGDGAQPAPAG